MQRCQNCGNEYSRTFQILMDGEKYIFDSFECAINALAPRCHHCETRVIGHGVELRDRIYCCARCAQSDGVMGLRDHLD